jgi:hypothetical protein
MIVRICSILILASSLIVQNGVSGYVSTSFSTFTGAGNAPLVVRESAGACPGGRPTLEMKKGNNLPPQMRGNFKQKKEMAEAREAMLAAQDPSDGFPVFNLFVRSKAKQSAGVSTCIMCRYWVQRCNHEDKRMQFL